jgi:hypothetical protein
MARAEQTRDDPAFAARYRTAAMTEPPNTADRIAAIERDIAKMRENVALIPRLVTLGEKHYETLVQLVDLFKMLRELVELQKKEPPRFQKPWG